jgi:hypothetical protein
MRTWCCHIPDSGLAFSISLALFCAGCGARSSSSDLDGGSGAESDRGLDDGHVDADGEGDAEAPAYIAVGFATGMSRFGVYKADSSRGRCAYVGFVAPVEDSTPLLDLPPSWDFEHGWVGEGSACDEPTWPPRWEETPVLGCHGWGEWDENVCHIDLDVTLVLENGETERLAAEGLSASGWGCGE